VELDLCSSADLEGICSVEEQSSVSPWPREVIGADLSGDSPYLYLCARAGDRILGFGTVLRKGKTSELANLAVLPEFRRRGVGSQLLAGLAEIAESLGSLRMNLYVRESNTGAAKLYRLFGFSVLGRIQATTPMEKTPWSWKLPFPSVFRTTATGGIRPRAELRAVHHVGSKMLGSYSLTFRRISSRDFRTRSLRSRSASSRYSFMSPGFPFRAFTPCFSESRSLPPVPVRYPEGTVRRERGEPSLSGEAGSGYSPSPERTETSDERTSSPSKRRTVFLFPPPEK
jgi:ribosomal-protein-alanine N-acetyltransferase